MAGKTKAMKSVFNKVGQFGGIPMYKVESGFGGKPFIVRKSMTGDSKWEIYSNDGKTFFFANTLEECAWALCREV